MCAVNGGTGSKREKPSSAALWIAQSSQVDLSLLWLVQRYLSYGTKIKALLDNGERNQGTAGAKSGQLMGPRSAVEDRR